MVEDDKEDMELFETVVRDLGIKNEIKWFPETRSAFEFLVNSDTKIYLIFCDINLPGRNGLAFKKEIDANAALRKKKHSICVLFYCSKATRCE
jgi:two-component SAPR family response regulator